MTEHNPRTAQPPHKINYENSQRNFGYVGHPLVKCDTHIQIRTMCGEGLTKLLRSTYVCLDSICDSFHKSKYLLFFIFCRRIPTSQLTILQNLKQFKHVNLYLQGFEDWSCGHWRIYLRWVYKYLMVCQICIELFLSFGAYMNIFKFSIQLNILGLLQWSCRSPPPF